MTGFQHDLVSEFRKYNLGKFKTSEASAVGCEKERADFCHRPLRPEVISFNGIDPFGFHEVLQCQHLLDRDGCIALASIADSGVEACHKFDVPFRVRWGGGGHKTRLIRTPD